MRLGIRDTTEGSVKITTTHYVVYCFLFVNLVKGIQQFETRYSDVRETGVNFAPLITEETAIRLLKPTDVIHNFIYFDFPEWIEWYSMRPKSKSVRMA